MNSIYRPHGKHTLPLILAFVFVDLLVIYNVLYHTEVGISVLWSVIWTAFILIVIAAFADREDKAFLFTTATISFVVNVLVAVYFISLGKIYFPDEEGYIKHGLEFSRRWGEEGFMSFFAHQYQMYDKNFGYYLLNGLHFLFWPHKVLIVITNVGLKTLTGFYVYLTAKKLYDRNIALVAGCFIFFNPYNVYWASFDLKDTALCFLIAAAMYLLSTLSRGNLAVRAPYLIVVLVLMTSIRFYALYLIGMAFAVYMLLSRNMSKFKKVGIASLMILAFVLLRSKFLIFNVISETGTVEYVTTAVQRANENLATGDFSMSSHATGMNPKALVMAFAHFILTPSPFNENPRVAYMIPGTLFWYFLVPYFAVGTYKLVRDSWKDNFFLYSYPILVMGFYSIVPWLGSSRHRLMIAPFVALISVVGLRAEFKHKNMVITLGYLMIALGVMVAEAVILA